MYSVNIIDTQKKSNNLPFRHFEYPNLMELIIDHLYDDIGECLGRGLCGTCHVKLITNYDALPIIDINEKNTLSKLENNDKNSRLACQIPLTDDIDKMTFKIITEDYLNI